MMTDQGKSSRVTVWENRTPNPNFEEFEMHGFNEGPLACFASFFPSPVTVDGKLWPSANHYFQAQKFVDEDYQEEIRAQPDAFLASTKGKNRGKPIVDGWDNKRYAVMAKVVEEKFRQNPELRTILLSTSKPILCHNPEDGFWGDGVGCGGTNQNSMGKILEDVRTKLRAEFS